MYLKKYLNNRWPWLSFAFFLSFIMPLIDYLTHQLNAERQYAYFLIIIGVLLVVVIDYYRYYHHIKLIQKMISQPLLINRSLSVSEKLCFEKMIEYQQLLKQQSAEYEEFIKDTDQYYSTWVHQIKTPIAAMQLVLDNQQLPSPIRTSLKIELQRIEQYVEVVLHYLRFQSFHDDLLIEEVNLDNVIKKVIKKYALSFSHKQLHLDYHPIQLTYLTDSKWFSLMFEQLFSNAVKYTHHGDISIYYQDEILFIKDTGIGIDEQSLPLLGRMGATGYNGRTNINATGLGLFIAYNTAKRLGLTIELESSKKGTIAKIHLPNQDKNSNVT